MNTYAKVQSLITAWKSQSLSRTDLIRAIAEACLGWPYVWGAAGQKCTPSHRRAYAARSACPEGEAARILKKCPVCSGKQEACSVCKYYPGGPVLDFDCRGFTRWLLAQAGVSLQGAGATSQWNTESNWEEKGPIAARDIRIAEVRGSTPLCSTQSLADQRLQGFSLLANSGKSVRLIRTSGALSSLESVQA